MVSKRFLGPALFFAAVVPATLQGCSDDGSNPLCCSEKEFSAGASIKIEGSAQSQVAVQAVADFAGIAGAAIDDLTTACRNIAQDLDAPKAEQDTAEGSADKRARMDAWCKLAVKTIGTVKASAGGTLSLTVTPPKCQASVSAKANCQAKCDVSGKCDIKANPPKCTGGKLEVACKGECKAEAGASVSCEGSCGGSCEGSCQAQGGVACKGKCEGSCKGTAQGGTGAGIQADGTCDGTCEGTCEVTAPGVKCEGSCQGKCEGSCTGSASASVKCDGKCEGDFEPLKCEGGKLEGGCQVDAKCDANCDASVSAKAECTPPEVKLQFSGAANAEVAANLVATLKANLPIVFGFKARLEGMAALSGTLAGNISGVADIKAACIPVVIAAAGNAGQDVAASASAAGSIVGSVQ